MGGRRIYQTKKNRRRPRQVHSRLGRGSLRKRITQRKRGGVDPRQMSKVTKVFRKYTPSYFFKEENEITIANDEALAQLGNKDNINLYFGTYHGTNTYLQQYKSFKGRVENGKLAYGEVEFSKLVPILHAPGKCIKYNGPFQQEGDKIGAPGGIIEFPEKVRDQFGDINLDLPTITCEFHESSKGSRPYDAASMFAMKPDIRLSTYSYTSHYTREYECILDEFEIIATKQRVLDERFTGFKNLQHFEEEENKDAIHAGEGKNVFVYIKEKKTIKFKLKNYKKVFEITCQPGIYTHGTFESAPAFGPRKYAKVFSKNMEELEREAKNAESLKHDPGNKPKPGDIITNVR